MNKLQPNKRARVFKLTPAANAAVETIAATTTRNLSNSACYLIELGYEQHMQQKKLSSSNLTEGDD